MGLPTGKRLAGVVTRAVVLTTNCRLCGPLLKVVNDVPLGNVAVPPVGAPATDSVTVFGMFPVGVTVTVKLAGMPAATVVVFGETLTAKLCTTATAGAAGVNTVDVPKILTFPPSLKVPGWSGTAGRVGARTTVTVPTCPPFNIPTVQVSTLLAGVGQLPAPGELTAETKVAVDGNTSVKMTPVVKSPLLVMV